jgi:retron-type reverse transcriptase
LLLGVRPKALSFLLYKTPTASKYTDFDIPKKSGGYREISAPIEKLRRLQSRLSELLYECQRETREPIKSTSRVHSHGFQKDRGLSIISNASVHINRRYVLNIDLDNFFPTINFGRVRGYFIKNRHFNLHEDVATVIAQIACKDNSLPQGAPSSPIISDLIASILDTRLAKLSARYGCSYTRYVDDLTFSTNKRSFPEELASYSPPTDGSWALGSKLVDIIERSGFVVNGNKTRMQLRHSNQSVTGLTVNQCVNVDKNFAATTRNMFYAQTTKGVCFCPTQGEGMNPIEARLILRGRLAFLYQVKRRQLSEIDQADTPAFKRMCERFKIYEKFFANDSPLVICEGYTDSIYLKAAIAKLASKFPSLAPTTLPTGETVPSIDFFKYSDMNGELLPLNGGAGQLNAFVAKYANMFHGFHAGGQTAPVIVLVDNDSASNKMWSVISEQLKPTSPKGVKSKGPKIDGSQSYYHVCRNLFVVPVPKLGNKDTIIEHLFDKATLEEKLGTKVFDPEHKGKMTDDKYGKAAFATQVVRKKAATIDFSGFEPLLQAIANVCSVALTPSK